MTPLQFAVPGGPEMFVFILVGIFALLIPFVMAFWVYNDAQARGNDNAALWALAVGGLGFLTFFGGVLALVIYIWDRD